MKHEFEFITTAADKNALPKIDCSRRQGREVRPLGVVARGLGSLEQPSWL